MSADGRQTRFRVEGMDCASCATKIDTAVRRLDNVADVKVSVVAGTMTVTHGERVDIDALAKKVGSLGYKTTPIAAKDVPVADEGAGHRHGPGCNHGHAEGPRNHSSERTGQTDTLAGLHGHDHGPSDGPWWKTSKARLTILCGAALAIAFGLAQIYPQTQPWGFIVAMAVGLIPIARRAIFGAMNGSPFTIETLM
ncbi:cation transporter, partial [Devosia sp.]